MALTLEFDFEDASMLFHTAMHAALFRDEDQAGRFDTLGLDRKENSLADLSLALPEYDEGSLLWCSTAGDALLLQKIHRASGYVAILLGDHAAEDASEVYVVLTSWNYREGEPELTDELVIAEFAVFGDDESSSAEVDQAARACLAQDKRTTLMGEPLLKDHGDHFHYTLIVTLPGNAIQEFGAELAHAVENSVAFEIVSREVDSQS